MAMEKVIKEAFTPRERQLLRAAMRFVIAHYDEMDREFVFDDGGELWVVDCETIDAPSEQAFQALFDRLNQPEN